MPQKRRVVITGIGTTSAVGVGMESLWKALLSGQSGAKLCHTFDMSGFTCPFVAQLAADQLDIKQFVPKSYRKATKVMARDIELAVAAAHEAVNDAGLITKAHEAADGKVSMPATQMGCQIGAGSIAAEENELTVAFASSQTAEVKPDFDYRTFLNDPKVHATTALNAQFALGAARQAWNQAGFHTHPPKDPRRVGLYLGAGEGVLDFDNYAGALISAWDATTQKVDGVRWAKAALARLDAFKEIEQEPNMSLAHLAREFGIRGPASNCLTACAASTQAIGEAFSMIRRGDADIMMSGGTHTMIHPLGVTGFNRLTALSTFKGDPTLASRPFCMSRDGFVMGEGSGMVILEKLEHALARGATPLAEVIGYGSSADAFRITDIQPEGRGAAAAINAALQQARIDPAAVGPDGRPLIHYISAHGTGTKENDSIESGVWRARQTYSNEQY